MQNFDKFLSLHGSSEEKMGEIWAKMTNFGADAPKLFNNLPDTLVCPPKWKVMGT